METFSPRNHRHQFRIESAEDFDAEYLAWMADAYAVDEQRHLHHS